jgi:hypothetical protein
MDETPLAVLRVYELAQVAGTVFGGYLVIRFGRTRFLAGLYVGCISIFFWDWIFTDSWFLNLTYDSRSINLFTIDGRPEPLWSPCSYATFFGVTTLLVLRHREWLEQRLGRWRFPVLAAFFVVLDVAVEGLVIAGLDVYRYGYRGEWKILGVPYTNLMWVTIILFAMVGTSLAVVRMQHDRGVFTVAGAPAPRETAASHEDAPAKEPWVMFALGAMICPAAFYLGVGIMTFVLAGLQPWI